MALRADRAILAGDVNAARSLVVKLRGRLPRRGNADGSWPSDKRLQDHAAAYHLERAAAHLKHAIEQWEVHSATPRPMGEDSDGTTQPLDV